MEIDGLIGAVVTVYLFATFAVYAIRGFSAFCRVARLGRDDAASVDDAGGRGGWAHLVAGLAATGVTFCAAVLFVGVVAGKAMGDSFIDQPIFVGMIALGIYSVASLLLRSKRRAKD